MRVYRARTAVEGGLPVALIQQAFQRLYSWTIEVGGPLGPLVGGIAAVLLVVCVFIWFDRRK